MRRLLLLPVAIVAVATPAASGADGVPVVVIEGKGFGHGVGMAQDGAFWMAQDGASTPHILSHFYPGTALGKGSGEVRVVVLPPVAANEAVLAFPNGGEVRDGRSGPQAPGFPVGVPPGGRVVVRFDGEHYTAVRADAVPAAYQVSDPTGTTSSSTSTTSSTSSTSTTTTTTIATTTTTSVAVTTSSTTPRPMSARALWAVPAGGGVVAVPARGRHYRGVVEATAVNSALRLVNHLDVEAYLRGMGEVRDPTWPPAALRAQAIAARTYALRSMTFGGELCDDQRCQVYLGSAAEYRAMDKAVADTKGQVLTYRNRLAAAVYSSNGGGVSASRQEGFGTPDTDGAHPYLRVAPYTTKDVKRWTVHVALTDVAARLNYPGRVTDVWVTETGPSGRALGIMLDGTMGRHAVTGIAFDRALGLRSTLFTMQVATSDSPPPPPPEAEVGLQALPDDVAALAPIPVNAPSAVEPIPALPDVAPVATGPARARRSGPPLPARVLALVVMVSASAVLLGWATARRAGLSARALRLF